MHGWGCRCARLGALVASLGTLLMLDSPPAAVIGGDTIDAYAIDRAVEPTGSAFQSDAFATSVSSAQAPVTVSTFSSGASSGTGSGAGSAFSGGGGSAGGGGGGGGGGSW